MDGDGGTPGEHDASGSEVDAATTEDIDGATTEDIDASPTEDIDASSTDSAAPDAADAGDLSGTYLTSQAIQYSCAINLVQVDVSAFFFTHNGDSLVVDSDDPGDPTQPCAMTGPDPGDGTFDVTCTIPGTCDEIYTLSGAFSNADSWNGTFTIQFQGSQCLNCTNQLLDIDAARCNQACPVAP